MPPMTSGLRETITLSFVRVLPDAYRDPGVKQVAHPTRFERVTFAFGQPVTSLWFGFPSDNEVSHGVMLTAAAASTDFAMMESCR
jgi:hypothetical protein